MVNVLGFFFLDFLKIESLNTLRDSMIFSGFFENIKMSISDRSSSWILEYFCRSFLSFFFFIHWELR